MPLQTKTFQPFKPSVASIVINSSFIYYVIVTEIRICEDSKMKYNDLLQNFLCIVTSGISERIFTKIITASNAVKFNLNDNENILLTMSSDLDVI